MISKVLRDLPFTRNQQLKSADDRYITILKNKLIKFKKKQEDRTLWLSHGTCSYIRMCVNAFAGSVMLCVQHDFYNIIFKITQPQGHPPPPPPPRKNFGCAPGHGKDILLQNISESSFGRNFCEVTSTPAEWTERQTFTTQDSTSFFFQVHKTWSSDCTHYLHNTVQCDVCLVSVANRRSTALCGSCYNICSIFWLPVQTTKASDCMAWLERAPAQRASSHMRL
jgi:hypothetical protein